MDTQDTQVKTISVGSLGYRYAVVSERHGRYITLSLTTGGNIVVSLTEDGEQELADLLERRAQDEARNYKYIWNDDEILGVLCEDLQGNGIGYTTDLGYWGHMTNSAGFSDDHIFEDDGTQRAERVWWMPDYAPYPTTLERLLTGILVFEWYGQTVSGVPDMPAPMRLF